MTMMIGSGPLSTMGALGIDKVIIINPPPPSLRMIITIIIIPPPYLMSIAAWEVRLNNSSSSLAIPIRHLKLVLIRSPIARDES